MHIINVLLHIFIIKSLLPERISSALCAPGRYIDCSFASGEDVVCSVCIKKGCSFAAEYRLLSVAPEVQSAHRVQVLVSLFCWVLSCNSTFKVIWQPFQLSLVECACSNSIIIYKFVQVPKNTVIQIWKGSAYDRVKQVNELGHRAIFSECWYLGKHTKSAWFDLYKCDPSPYTTGMYKFLYKIRNPDVRFQCISYCKSPSECLFLA